MAELYFYITLVFFSYYGLVLLSRQKFLFIIFSILFITCTLALRLSVDIKENADYYGYYFLIREDFVFKVSTILSEPYFPLLGLFLKRMFDVDKSLFVIYMINFSISTIFFIWLASKKDIKIWVKILLFSLEYVLITYTTIRNSVAYILFGILIYNLLKKNSFFFGYLGFLSHASALPALLSTFLGFEKPTLKKIIFIILSAALVGIILNLPVFNHISSRIDSYSVESQYGQSIYHKIYFLFMVILTIILFYTNKKSVTNTFYIAIFTLYIFLFFLSPVMSYRFSIYIVFYLCIYPYYKHSKYDKLLNILSIFLFINFFNSFFDSHHDLLLLK